MREINLRDKILYSVILLCVVTIIIVLTRSCYKHTGAGSDSDAAELQQPVSKFMYGICIDSLDVEDGEIASGQTLSTLLDPHGIGVSKIEQMLQASKDVFDVKSIRAGNNYSILISNDSIPAVTNFIYEINVVDFVVYTFGDSVSIRKDRKDITRKKVQHKAVIESSLWNAMVGAGMNPTLAMNLSDVFQWSIDFYAIQENDAFNVLYEELFIDDKSIGVDTIFGAWFEHNGKKHYAIRHSYTDSNGDKISGYWDEEGKSLKSPFLKAPLRYSRISSKFSRSRLHPILRIRRPHLGVDYAAPSGTQVEAIGDGVVTMRKYSGGGGNTIKIRHARGYQSGYLHLKGYAKGLTVGSRVTQGQVIGYVGSTGLSTGPHLDFRIWLNGTAIDPLKIANTKGEDIASKYKAGFMKSKERVIRELDGVEPVALQSDSLQSDSIQ